MLLKHNIFEFFTNVVLTNICNFNLNPTKISNATSMFYNILFHQHMFIMFFNTVGQLNYIIFDKTRLTSKKMSHVHVTFSLTLCFKLYLIDNTWKLLFNHHLIKN